MKLKTVPGSPERCEAAQPPARRTCEGEVGNLYRSLAPRLRQIVRHDVRTSDAVIEDACQSAWSRLVAHASCVGHDGALGWLVRTAGREAIKLTHRQRRELAGDPDALGEHEALEALIEQREQLATLDSLSTRQQRMLWLQALGLSYVEIALHEDCSTRTVERQVLRARARLRLMDLDRDGA